MQQLTLDMVLALGTVIGALIAMAVTTISAEMILLGAMVFVMATRVVTPEQAVQGFANTGVLTIAALYVVVAGLRETGAISWVTQLAFRRPGSVRGAQAPSAARAAIAPGAGRPRLKESGARESPARSAPRSPWSRASGAPR